MINACNTTQYTLPSFISPTTYYINSGVSLTSLNSFTSGLDNAACGSFNYIVSDGSGNILPSYITVAFSNQI